MMVADFSKLNGTEEFIGRLRQTNVMERGELEAVLAATRQKFRMLPEPPALADFLVEQGVLNRFQADLLLKGAGENLVIERYVVVGDLGAGSMGTVYRARSRMDQREYALKLLPRRSMWNVRLARRYAKAFTRVEHPAVVPFTDIGTAGGQHYLVWPFVEGEPLSRIVGRKGKMQPGLAAHYLHQIAAGLACCHNEMLVHGLLSPANIVIGGDGQARLLDFGIGAILAQTSDQESLIHTQGQISLLTSGIDCGSPESMLDPADRKPAGDQYGLGCILYYCVTGRLPFEGPPVQKMKAHRGDQPPPVQELNPDVSDELAAVIDRLMQKLPSARYASMEEVVEALKPLAVVPSPVEATPRTQRELPTRKDLGLQSSVEPRPVSREPRDEEDESEEVAAQRNFSHYSGIAGWMLAAVLAAIMTGFLAGWLLGR